MSRRPAEAVCKDSPSALDVNTKRVRELDAFSFSLSEH